MILLSPIQIETNMSKESEVLNMKQESNNDSAEILLQTSLMLSKSKSALKPALKLTNESKSALEAALKHSAKAKSASKRALKSITESKSVSKPTLKPKTEATSTSTSKKSTLEWLYQHSYNRSYSKKLSDLQACNIILASKKVNCKELF